MHIEYPTEFSFFLSAKMSPTQINSQKEYYYINKKPKP